MILKKKTYYTGDELSPENKVFAKPGAVYVSSADGSIWFKNGAESKEGWTLVGSLSPTAGITIPDVLKIDAEGLKLWNTTQNSWILITAIGNAGAQSLDLTPST